MGPSTHRPSVPTSAEDGEAVVVLGPSVSSSNPTRFAVPVPLSTSRPTTSATVLPIYVVVPFRYSSTPVRFVEPLSASRQATNFATVLPLSASRPAPSSTTTLPLHVLASLLLHSIPSFVSAVRMGTVAAATLRAPAAPVRPSLALRPCEFPGPLPGRIWKGRVLAIQRTRAGGLPRGVRSESWGLLGTGVRL